MPGAPNQTHSTSTSIFDLARTIVPLVFFRNVSVSEIWNPSQEITQLCRTLNPCVLLDCLVKHIERGG